MRPLFSRHAVGSRVRKTLYVRLPWGNGPSQEGTFVPIFRSSAQKQGRRKGGKGDSPALPTPMTPSCSWGSAVPSIGLFVLVKQSGDSQLGDFCAKDCLREAAFPHPSWIPRATVLTSPTFLIFIIHEIFAWGSPLSSWDGQRQVLRLEQWKVAPSNCPGPKKRRVSFTQVKSPGWMQKKEFLEAEQFSVMQVMSNRE